jgi:hypothetical protein
MIKLRRVRRVRLSKKFELQYVNQLIVAVVAAMVKCECKSNFEYRGESRGGSMWVLIVSAGLVCS